MPSALVPQLQRIAPYFVIGWLFGVAIVARPSPESLAPHGTVRTRSAESYEPPLHPATVALGQVLFSVLGLAVCSRQHLQAPVPVRHE